MANALGRKRLQAGWRRLERALRSNWPLANKCAPNESRNTPAFPREGDFITDIHSEGGENLIVCTCIWEMEDHWEEVEVGDVIFAKTPLAFTAHLINDLS